MKAVHLHYEGGIPIPHFKHKQFLQSVDLHSKRGYLDSILTYENASYNSRQSYLKAALLARDGSCARAVVLFLITELHKWSQITDLNEYLGLGV